MNYLLIGTGGAVGSLLRYIVSLLTNKILDGNYSYFGTLFVNIVGSFALSFLITRWMNKNKIPKIWGQAIGTGLIGSFTTFSTLSNELLQLLQQKTYLQAIIYFSISSIGGIYVSFLGYRLGKKSKGGRR